MRVIFVGVHNKVGLKPLDSKSKSGKLIDRVADLLKLKGFEILKTNLFDTDYLPHYSERGELAMEWVERVELKKQDIIVLLGAITHENFPCLPSEIIRVAHPSSKRSHKEMDEYVEKTLAAILQTVPVGAQ